MKKRITFLLLFISIFPLPLALAFQRTDKMPSFFMPQNAVSTTSRTERSPLAERVRRQEEQRRLQEEALKAAQQQTDKQETPQNEQKITPLEETPPVIKTAKEKNLTPTPPTAENQPNESVTNPTHEEHKSVQIKKRTPDDNLPSVLSIATPVNPTLPTEPKISENIYNRPVTGSVASYKRIKEEHKHDLNLISSGRYTENPRLKKVLSEFKNEEHMM